MEQGGLIKTARAGSSSSAEVVQKFPQAAASDVPAGARIQAARRLAPGEAHPPGWIPAPRIPEEPSAIHLAAPSPKPEDAE